MRNRASHRSEACKAGCLAPLFQLPSSALIRALRASSISDSNADAFSRQAIFCLTGAERFEPNYCELARVSRIESIHIDPLILLSNFWEGKRAIWTRIAWVL